MGETRRDRVSRCDGPPAVTVARIVLAEHRLAYVCTHDKRGVPTVPRIPYPDLSTITDPEILAGAQGGLAPRIE